MKRCIFVGKVALSPEQCKSVIHAVQHHMDWIQHGKQWDWCYLKDSTDIQALQKLRNMLDPVEGTLLYNDERVLVCKLASMWVTRFSHEPYYSVATRTLDASKGATLEDINFFGQMSAIVKLCTNPKFKKPGAWNF